MPSRRTNAQPTNPLSAGAELVADGLRARLMTAEYAQNGQPRTYFETPADIYGVCEVYEKDSRPQVKINARDFEQLLPDDGFKSRAFFYVHDPATRSVGDAYVLYDMSIIVWYNEDRFSSEYPFRIKENFIAAIRKALYLETRQYEIQEFRDTRNVFSMFDLNYNRLFTGQNHDCFRIRSTFEGSYCSTELVL